MAKVPKAVQIDLGAPEGDAARAVITVVYDGRVNLRSAPRMDPGNIVGKAAKGASFVALDTLEENGHKWYYLEGGQYIRADGELVAIK